MSCFWTNKVNVEEDCGEAPPAGAVAYYVWNNDYPALVSTTWGVVGEYAFPLTVDGEEFIPDGDGFTGMLFYGTAELDDTVTIEWFNTSTEEDETEVVSVEHYPTARLVLANYAGEFLRLFSAGFLDPIAYFNEDLGPFTVTLDAGGVLTFDWSDDENTYLVVGDTRPEPPALIGPGTFFHSTYGTHEVVLLINP